MQRPSLGRILLGEFSYFIGTMTALRLLLSLPAALRSPSFGGTIFVLIVRSSQRLRTYHGKPGVVIPESPPDTQDGRNSSSQVPGEPLVHLPCSQTPVGQWYQVAKVPLCCPRILKNEDSNEAVFEAQSHSFCTRCLRFTLGIASYHARLASGC